MYIGRFVIVGPGIAGYRVSSRSFPNRQIIDRDELLTVGPTPAASATENPYISCHCLRSVKRADQQIIVVGNGSHVDAITEKIGLGYPTRDALALSLLALDFEKDDYDTPRVAGAVGANSAYIAIVRHDGLVVKATNEPMLVATYERDTPEVFDLGAETAGDIARELYTLEFEHPVCAAAATIGESGINMEIYNDD